jgi:hypothetical protein
MNHNPVTKWPKGVSGNPKGRPRKAQTVTETLERIVAACREDGRTRLEAILEGVVADAEKGDNDMRKYVLDRLAGKPRQSLEHSGPVGGPIVLDINEAKRLADAVERLTNGVS